MTIYPDYAHRPSVFPADVGAGRLTRFSMGLLLVDTPEHYAASVPRTKNPVLYDMQQSMASAVHNDTLRLALQAPSQHYIRKPVRVPNTDTRELVVLYTVCITTALLLYFVHVYRAWRASRAEGGKPAANVPHDALGAAPVRTRAGALLPQPMRPRGGTPRGRPWRLLPAPLLHTLAHVYGRARGLGASARRAIPALGDFLVHVRAGHA
ncbi:hypothetical protein MSPP1_003990 [Malassezia sp. CBS 17886]|nr:hypothetical protein MSPP1_003990 [Malassezia sp. CBS 17886]